MEAIRLIYVVNKHIVEALSADCASVPTMSNTSHVFMHSSVNIHSLDCVSN